MAGPGIRYWNIAKELSKHFEVKLFTPNKCSLTTNFEIIKLSKKLLLKECKNASCIILQGRALWENPYLKKINIPIAIDLYDPFIFENFELDINLSNASNLHKASLSILLDQLLYGDYFFCASEKQRDFWIGMLTAINRINPKEYIIDKTMNHLIGIVPFGIPDERPQKTKQVLKGVYPGINPDDKVIIWGGGIWDWLDPITAIKAMRILSEKRKDVKLFFMGTKPPNPGLVQMKMINEAINLSDSLNLTNKYVFFNDWVDYKERQNYFLESDVGISLHFNHLETKYSFRTRILDYIWCNLPIICTQGDVMSEIVSQYRIGKTVPPENADVLSREIEAFLNAKIGITTFEMISKQLTWSKVLEPLIKFCFNPQHSKGKDEKVKISGLINNKFQYYIIKTISLIKKGELSTVINKMRSKLYQ